MNDDALATLADTNYFETFRAMAGATGAPVLETDGLLCVATGVPVAFLNVGFVTRPLDEPESALGRAIRFFDGRRVPFVVRAREGVDAAAERAAERLGLPYSDTVPGMAMFPLPPPPPAPAGLRVTRVEGADDLATFQDLMSTGFSMPPEIARLLFTIRSLEIPGFEFYLGYVDGTPVTASTLCPSGRAAGVYNVVTLRSHRRRGLGAAMTWHAVARGAAAGCDVAILQASEMGKPVYAGMGFRVVAPYRTFHRPQSGAPPSP